VLRTELYALDSTARQDRPYTVTERAYGLQEIARPESGEPPRRRIFFPHLLAERTTQWERGDEPMTQFAFTDDYDLINGQPRRQVTLAVPRHRDYRAPAPAGAPYMGTLVETRYAQRDDAERYIVDRVAASTSFEILNGGRPPIFDLYRQIQAGTAARKLFGQTCNYYDGERFVGLPFGQLGDFGALVRTQGGQVEVTHYIDAVFEHHRWGEESQAGANNHVHVMDDIQRIALVRLGAAHPEGRGPAVQFQLGDHLDSSNVVVDLGGALVNREEFTPFGETSFGSFAKKR
jgi:hypothetical protein